MSDIKNFFKRTEWSYLIGGAAILLIGGILSSLLGGNTDYYELLNKPAFAAPRFIFPIAWTLLYILLGAAAGQVLSSRNPAVADEKRRGLILFGISLILNYIWYPLFFAAMNPVLALIDIIAMLVLSLFVVFDFFKVKRWTGFVMLLYCLWLIYASALNAAIVTLN